MNPNRYAAYAARLRDGLLPGLFFWLFRVVDVSLWEWLDSAGLCGCGGGSVCVMEIAHGTGFCGLLSETGVGHVVVNSLRRLHGYSAGMDDGGVLVAAVVRSRAK